MSLSRRSFVAASGATAALAAAGASAAMADEAAQAPVEDEVYVVDSFDADETVDADIVVMGTGMSGTAATLQAAELGLKVIALEAADITGGNGQFTEGIAAVDSSMAKEQGIHVDSADIVHSELEFFNYRIDALYWIDAIENSGANLDWMIEHGALFDGTIDNDRGNGNVQTFHWFKERMAVNAVEPMMQAAQDMGAEVRTGMRGSKLVMKDGKVAGIVAVSESDGSTLLVNTPAVVFASGGYAANYDLMVKRGCPPVFYCKSNLKNRGDALLMAEAAGGVNIAANSAQLFSVTIPALSFMESFFMQKFGQVLIVNGRGERFTDESCGSNAIGCYLNTLSQQKNTYMILTKNIADAIDELNPSVGSKIVAYCTGQETTEFAREAAIGGDAIQDSVLGTLYGEDEPDAVAFNAPSIAELAEQIGIDPDALSATFERYNELCGEGVDRDFGKDPADMVALDDSEGVYALRMYPGYATSIGGIKTNRNYQVIDEYDEPVEGLYAVGCDGTMMYRETYTIEVPGSCNMGNVHSARTAVKHAAENLL